MLDRLKRTGSRFSNVADVGTGTGLLAFAAFRLWPAARVIASDIDPVAIAVCHENANANAIALGAQRGSVELVVAAGLAHRRLRRRAPYDLIIANILAGPLIELAPVLAGAIKPGGSVILAGLLDSQAEAVTAAYRLRGMRLAHRIDQGSWPTLRLEKRKRFARIKRPG
jgi:ribosomal protein L11 methyltransferase